MMLIECLKVSFEYNTEIVLEDVNFQLSQGDYLSILGENGSGKSTLIKGILNAKQPMAGNINLGSDLKYEQIGYLPQNKTMMKDFPASVYEVVLSGRINQMGFRPFYSKKDKLIAMENIKKLGIENLKNKSFSELSGGQQQRVLLARGLTSANRVFVLDEPVAGLDPNASDDFYALIKNLNETEGLTIIMVSHDIERATKESSHILHLANKQLFYGKSADYRSHDVSKVLNRGGSL